MKDLISRQAAIDVADAVWSVTGDKNVAKVWDQIKDLPSAQPEINCSEFPNNSDTISRQAAIDAIFGRSHEIIKMRIGNLPSAQPKSYREGYQAGFKDAQPEPSKDAVSRADVVDMLEMFPFTEYSEYETAREVVKRLPPAQPERIRGKWEIYVISMFDGVGCRCSECGFEGVPYWDFCPNCGADMRGEQDE